MIFFGFYIFVSQKFSTFFAKLINAKFREKSENYCNFSQNYRTSFFNEIPYCFASKITFRDNVTKRKSLRNTKGNFAFSRMFLFAETQIYCEWIVKSFYSPGYVCYFPPCAFIQNIKKMFKL